MILETAAYVAIATAAPQETPSLAAVIERLGRLESENAELRRRLGELESERGSSRAVAPAAPVAPVSHPSAAVVGSPAGPAESDADNWSGWYAGLGAAVTYTGQAVQVLSSGNSGNGPGLLPFVYSPPVGESFDSEDLRPELIAGYNAVSRSGWLFGVEARVTPHETVYSASHFPGFGARIGRTDSDRFSVEIGNEAEVRARIGWVLDRDTLLYATGGVAVIEYKVKASCDVLRSTSQGFTTSTICFGIGQAADEWNEERYAYSLGVGAERRVSTDWSVRLGYRFTDYGDSKHTFLETLPAGLRGGSLDTLLPLTLSGFSIGAVYQLP